MNRSEVEMDDRRTFPSVTMRRGSFFIGFLSGVAAPLLFWPAAPLSGLRVDRSSVTSENAWRRVGAYMREAMRGESARHG